MKNEVVEFMIHHSSFLLTRRDRQVAERISPPGNRPGPRVERPGRGRAAKLVSWGCPEPNRCRRAVTAPLGRPASTVRWSRLPLTWDQFRDTAGSPTGGGQE